MKNFSCWKRLLVLVLALQMLITPAVAAETGTESQGEESTAQTTEMSEPESEPSEQPQTEPSVPVYTIPENFTGDASVAAGCNSIDANVPLINPGDLEVELGAALMYEMNSGTLLYTYNPDERMYPASVTKVMTCLLALENAAMDEIVTVSEAVIANRDPNGSGANLVAGEQMPMKEMLYCLMVSSANDAGSAISEHIAGSEDAFVEMMNQKAEELGCTNTHFSNPHGLHDENHYTSARDLAKIMLAALEYDTFNEIYSTKTHVVPATNKSEARELTSTNYMIEDSQIEYYYDERVIGGKTGFTTPAGRCLATVAESDGMKLLTVVLGGKTGQNQNGQVEYYSFKETGNLIDYGFANFSYGRVLTPDAILTSFPVAGGENNTQATVREAVSIVIPNGLDREQLRYEYVLNDGTLTAPIEAGEPIGFVRVWYETKCLSQREIYATVSSDVKPTQVNDPAVSNVAVEENRDIWHIVLVLILVLLILIVLMLLISAIRSRILRARRRRRRRNAKRRH